jgi:hypothetical protein
MFSHVLWTRRRAASVLKKGASSLLVYLPLLIAFSAPIPAEEECLKSAWQALDGGQFQIAMTAADQCVRDFSAEARRQQEALRRSGEPTPPTGKVASAADRQAILERWAVNDVAAAYFVKGKAAEQLATGSAAKQYLPVARQAFEEAVKLSYGRTWDTKGWFWSPSQAAQDRLALLTH